VRRLQANCSSTIQTYEPGPFSRQRREWVENSWWFIRNREWQPMACEIMTNFKKKNYHFGMIIFLISCNMIHEIIFYGNSNKFVKSIKTKPMFKIKKCFKGQAAWGY
jgi:hypothetical protein